MPRPLLVGIVNITERFVFRRRPVSRSRSGDLRRRAALAADGADIVELGAAASNVAAEPVSPAEEIRRLDPVIRGALRVTVTPLAIDTCQPEVQRFALARGVDYLNDIQGFPDPAIYPDLAAATCRLVVMHCGAGRGPGAVGSISGRTRCGGGSRSFSPSAAWRGSSAPASPASG